MNAITPDDSAAARVHADVLDQCDRLFRRLEHAGALRPNIDLIWARNAYYALVHEAAQNQPAQADEADALATLVIDTLLGGIGRQSLNTDT